MKYLIPTLFCLFTFNAFSQHFELHYDAVTVVYDKGHENIMKTGVIEIDKSQIKYNNGHAEDLFYRGKSQDGAFVRYSWARLEDPGSDYIVMRTLEGHPFQLAIRAYGNVILSADKIIKKDSTIYYTDTNRNSLVFNEN